VHRPTTPDEDVLDLAHEMRCMHGSGRLIRGEL